MTGIQAKRDKMGGEERYEPEMQGARVLQVIRSRLQLKMPEFSAAFGYFSYCPSYEIEGLGTDGEILFYHPQETVKKFLEEEETLLREYFHLVLHLLYLHVPASGKKKEEFWNAACDWTVEYLSEKVYELGAQGEPELMRSKWYEKLEEISLPVQADEVYRWLLRNPQDVAEIQKVFHRDDHSLWKTESTNRETCGKKGDSGAQERLARMGEVARCWNQIRSQIGIQAQEQKRRTGVKSGTVEALLTLKKEKTYDYRSFLRRYAVFREELLIDMESFDYLLYVYSREHYEKLLLLEPLESMEVHRLEELVIAIDTSGSCSGEVVRQFMEETYQILSSRESFFNRMNVIIIQCDSMIQGYTRIRSQEEWKAYVLNLKVRGFGGTDFRPVFQLVERKRKQGELKNLKGLLYFTDGDGIFPEKGPDYETAFVFLNSQYEKGKAPDWAVRLNLNLDLSSTEQRSRS